MNKALDYGSNQDKRTGVILVPFLIFLFGAALGVASKLLDIWKDTPMLHKVITVFSVIVSLAVVTLAVLQILDIWTQAINLCIPLMGVNLLCQTYMQWNTSSKTAYFSLGCAVFVFACAIAVFFIK